MRIHNIGQFQTNHCNLSPGTRLGALVSRTSTKVLSSYRTRAQFNNCFIISFKKYFQAQNILRIIFAYSKSAKHRWHTQWLTRRASVNRSIFHNSVDICRLLSSFKELFTEHRGAYHLYGKTGNFGWRNKWIALFCFRNFRKYGLRFKAMQFFHPF